ncbi:MAG: peptidylprolyl isomerase [Lachnospiraceae bacterium]|nr:peptidylprolyl isomerase [Lachnospiraceae bacterium]
MKNGKKRILFFLCCLLSMTMPGCGKKEGDVKLVLTTGFKKDEIFRIETMSCTLPEVMVYLTNTQDQYESVYGEEIWKTHLDGVTLEESIKETVLAQLAQIKTMNLLAQQHGVSLEDGEREKAREAAGIYFGSLNETEREAMQVNEEIIEQLYGELALANKVYEFIIKDINPEISDDEARSITIQDILIKTYSQDGAGKRIAYEETAREDAYERAREILLLAREEENDFESLVLQYSEGEKGTYSFGKGEVEEDFENAAFNLETGEISGVVETEDGFHIIKCISTFNREETDANKVKIVEKRREEVFGQEYDAFVDSLTRTLNEELWNSVAFLEDDAIVTRDFFDIYYQIFAK